PPACASLHPPRQFAARAPDPKSKWESRSPSFPAANHVPPENAANERPDDARQSIPKACELPPPNGNSNVTACNKSPHERCRSARFPPAASQSTARPNSDRSIVCAASSGKTLSGEDTLSERAAILHAEKPNLY